MRVEKRARRHAREQHGDARASASRAKRFSFVTARARRRAREDEARCGENYPATRARVAPSQRASERARDAAEKRDGDCLKSGDSASGDVVRTSVDIYTKL